MKKIYIVLLTLMIVLLLISSYQAVVFNKEIQYLKSQLAALCSDNRDVEYTKIEKKLDRKLIPEKYYKILWNLGTVLFCSKHTSSFKKVSNYLILSYVISSLK